MLDWIKKNLKIILTVLLVVLLLIAIIFMINGYRKGCFENEAAFQAYIQSFGLAAPIMLTVIQALQVIIPVLPGFLGSIVGAGMFGWWGGFLCNYIGISAGSIIAFILAEKLGLPFVRTIIPEKKFKKWEKWVNRSSSYTVILFLVILLPLAPDDFFCYFSGLAGMPRKKFIWIIIIAKPWCLLFYSLLFSGIISYDWGKLF